MKYKTQHYRHCYVVYLITEGVNTVPKLVEETDLSRRTIQGVIATLQEMGVDIEHTGSAKSGSYLIGEWPWILPSKQNIKKHLQHVRTCC